MPFHSRLFRRAVGPLRRMLLTTWDVEHIKVDALESKWIPNVTGQPFQLSKPYLGMCLDKIPTPVLKKLLQSWDAVIGMPQGRKVVAYNMLVEIMVRYPTSAEYVCIVSSLLIIITSTHALNCLAFVCPLRPNPGLSNLLAGPMDGLSAPSSSKVPHHC